MIFSEHIIYEVTALLVEGIQIIGDSKYYHTKIVFNDRKCREDTDGAHPNSFKFNDMKTLP